MTIDPIQFAASTSSAATEGVRVAADSLDTGTATEVYVQVIKFGYGTEGVYNQVASGQGLPIATGFTLAVEQNPTATVPVSLADSNFTASQSAHDSLNANANLQVSDTDVSAANAVWVRIAASGTATQAVAVTQWTATDLNVNLAQTATVAITGSVAITQATESIVTQDTATDLNVTVATTATHDVAVTSYTATGVGLIRPLVARGNQVPVLFTTTATTVATLATAVTNTNLDLVGIHVVNSGTGPVGISIRDTSTASSWDHELAADGGGFAMNFWPPKEQTNATAWTMQLDAQPSAKVSVMMQLVKVT